LLSFTSQTKAEPVRVSGLTYKTKRQDRRADDNVHQSEGGARLARQEAYLAGICDDSDAAERPKSYLRGEGLTQREGDVVSSSRSELGDGSDGQQRKRWRD